ncbi:MAG: glutathione S-transferase [Rhodospirillaceae bacterium]|jgi:glutathione S-transferase|nr:glutathione S-transferase [Rhodospirillaceae bacterium]
MAYQFYYWPHIQGRGEVVRLALEESGADYDDIARQSVEEGGGKEAVLGYLQDQSLVRPPFAPPFLIDGEAIIAQAANILQYLGPKIGLAPASEADRLFAHQIQLTVTDFLMEVHDTHHPIASTLYYEDQKEAAVKRSANFIEYRMPKHMAYYERIITNNQTGSGWLIGDTLTYPDLSMYQIVEGLRYAFPIAFGKIGNAYPNLLNLRDLIAARPNINDYLTSSRRIPFSTMGVFRHYPELDE